MKVILMGFLLSLFGANLFAYDRKEWRHWIDADHDCQNTRQEVLQEESLIPVETNPNGCKIIAGRWRDPYTGLYYTDPSELDVDHTIPLKLAAESGGDLWDATKKKAYANDLANPAHLIAIHKGINRSKGGKPIHPEKGPSKTMSGIALEEKAQILGGKVEGPGSGQGGTDEVARSEARARKNTREIFPRCPLAWNPRLSVPMC